MWVCISPRIALEGWLGPLLLELNALWGLEIPVLFPCSRDVRRDRSVERNNVESTGNRTETSLEIKCDEDEDDGPLVSRRTVIILIISECPVVSLPCVSNWFDGTCFEVVKMIFALGDVVLLSPAFLVAV